MRYKTAITHCIQLKSIDHIYHSDKKQLLFEILSENLTGKCLFGKKIIIEILEILQVSFATHILEHNNGDFKIFVRFSAIVDEIFENMPIVANISSIDDAFMNCEADGILVAVELRKINTRFAIGNTIPLIINDVTIDPDMTRFMIIGDILNKKHMEWKAFMVYSDDPIYYELELPPPTTKRSLFKEKKVNYATISIDEPLQEGVIYAQLYPWKPVLYIIPEDECNIQIINVPKHKQELICKISYIEWTSFMESIDPKSTGIRNWKRTKTVGGALNYPAIDEKPHNHTVPLSLRKIIPFANFVKLAGELCEVQQMHVDPGLGGKYHIIEKVTDQYVPGMPMYVPKKYRPLIRHLFPKIKFSDVKEDLTSEDVANKLLDNGFAELIDELNTCITTEKDLQNTNHKSMSMYEYKKRYGVEINCNVSSGWLRNILKNTFIKKSHLDLRLLLENAKICQITDYVIPFTGLDRECYLWHYTHPGIAKFDNCYDCRLCIDILLRYINRRYPNCQNTIQKLEKIVNKYLNF